MSKAKVSVILPCYNGEKTIKQALEGVIHQTYRPIEFILVNDGSTDASDRIIQDLTPTIVDAGIEFKYLPQENKGLGGAINTGLKEVTGDYLCWIDADDELVPESFEIRAKFMDSHPDFGSVSSNAVFFTDEGNSELDGKLVTEAIDINSNESQFLHMLLSRSIFCAGAHMIKVCCFRYANNGMEIYASRSGQNFQMLLPIYYTHKHGFINKALYRYRISISSMSSKVMQMPLLTFYKKQKEYYIIILETLKRIRWTQKRDFKYYAFILKKHIIEQNLDRTLTLHNHFFSLYWKIRLKLLNITSLKMQSYKY